MLKLCINSRDELFILDLDKVAYMQAAGNYTRIVYISKVQTMVTLGLSKLEEMIRMVTPKDAHSPYVRLGRSLLINQTYLAHISTLRRRLTLSDNQGNAHVLEVPKALLVAYKELIHNGFKQVEAKR